MKKLLALLIILSIVNIAGAAVLKVVPVDIGESGGRLGLDPLIDPLEKSDTIGLAIVIENNPFGPNPLGDGYWISSFNLDLEVTGPASLAIGEDWAGNPVLYAHANISPFSYTPVVENAIAQLTGVGLNPAGPGEADLVWNFLLHCDGPGEDVVIDLTLNSQSRSQYAEYDKAATGGNWVWLDMVEGDLGDLVIYQIPEPMTVALLGLGGLFLLRRRK